MTGRTTSTGPLAIRRCDTIEGVRFAALLSNVVVIVVVAACSSDPQPVTATPKTGSSTGPASFEKDVMPIIGNSCALTACHAAAQSNLGIHLTFDKAQVYAELQKSSPTFAGVPFVVAGKPDDSLVMGKIDGTQGKVPGCTSGCGNAMPPPPDPLLDDDQRAIIRRWIANGAKND
jgi:hypothetical protein